MKWVNGIENTHEPNIYSYIVEKNHTLLYYTHFKHWILYDDADGADEDNDDEHKPPPLELKALYNLFCNAKLIAFLIIECSIGVTHSIYQFQSRESHKSSERMSEWMRWARKMADGYWNDCWHIQVEWECEKRKRDTQDPQDHTTHFLWPLCNVYAHKNTWRDAIVCI